MRCCAAPGSGRRPQLLFLKQFFDNVYLQVALGQEVLEAGILFFEISDAGRVRGIHAAKAGAPAIEGTLRNVVLAADLGDRAIALFGLLQEGDDLRVGKLIL